MDAASWPRIVEDAQLSGMIRQFALNCIPVSFEQDVLRLALDPQAADRRTQQVEDRLVQQISRFMERPIRVVIESAHAEVATPARQRAREEQQRSEDAVQSFDKDPAVRALRDRFGAAVEGGSVKPVQGT